MNYEKERLFDDAIRGIIESVENINCKYKLLEKGLICMEKTDHNTHSVYLMYYHLIMAPFQYQYLLVLKLGHH